MTDQRKPLKLHEIANQEEYQETINRQAALIVNKVINQELDHRNKETIETWLETQESWQHAIKRLDQQWQDYKTLDIAATYDIIKENYQQTLTQVEQNKYNKEPEAHPVQSFRRYVLHCMAYDLAKTVDHKLNQIISDDKSTQTVKIT